MVDVLFYAEADIAPALEWLLETPLKVQAKFEWLLELLEKEGHRARRPHAAPLSDGIYELRAQRINVHYRLLYFFDGNTAVVIAHGCTKEGAVEPADLQRACERRDRYLRNREQHTYSEPE